MYVLSYLKIQLEYDAILVDFYTIKSYYSRTDEYISKGKFWYYSFEHSVKMKYLSAIVLFSLSSFVLCKGNYLFRVL